MKTKFPRELALKAAKELCAALTPWTEWIKVAGSLRRRKAEVGDVEILYVPKIQVERHGLFQGEEAWFDLAEVNSISPLLNSGVLKKRPNVNGSFTWGPQNKLAVHAATGVPVDLFATTNENKWLSLVIRTGPKELNVALILAARERGLALHAYGVFTKLNCLENGELEDTGEKVVPGSEEEVFELCGRKYLEPWERV